MEPEQELEITYFRWLEEIWMLSNLLHIVKSPVLGIILKKTIFLVMPFSFHSDGHQFEQYSLFHSPTKPTDPNTSEKFIKAWSTINADCHADLRFICCKTCCHTHKSSFISFVTLTKCCLDVNPVMDLYSLWTKYDPQDWSIYFIL